MLAKAGRESNSRTINKKSALKLIFFFELRDSVYGFDDASGTPGVIGLVPLSLYSFIQYVAAMIRIITRAVVVTKPINPFSCLIIS